MISDMLILGTDPSVETGWKDGRRRGLNVDPPNTLQRANSGEQCAGRRHVAF